MSSIQNIDISLQEAVKSISKNSYLIPKFQRDFVWNVKDILDLGDSIIRGYPISSMLIMAENGTLKVGSHSLSKDDPPKDYEHNPDESEIRFYILDGQQRLTSISKLFLNFDNKNEFYFDLLTILVDKYPEDGIENDRGVKKKCMTSKVGEVFCRNFSISSDRSEKPTRQNNRFISGKNIIENKFGSVVSKFLRVLEDASEENIDKYTDHLNAVLGSVGSYSIPATVIASDSELGVVIRVFEKVNSTGKKLTLFDLINAKSFQINNEIYKGGLSDYLTNDISNRLQESPELSVGVNGFLKYKEDERSFEKLDKIVRVLEVSSLLLKNSSPAILQSAMLTKDPEFWFEGWIEHGEKFLEVARWMEDEGVLDVGQTTFLEYSMAIFLANPRSFEYKRFTNEIKKYALYLAVSGTSFNKTNLDVVERLYSISKQITDSHESDKYNFSSPSGTTKLTQDSVLEITPSNSKFKAIMNICYLEKADAKFTVDIKGNRVGDSGIKKMDNHHIFPRSRVNNFTAKSKFNSIANIVLLDGAANRELIKDKAPSDYFSVIRQDANGCFNCEQNLIDIELASKVEDEGSALPFLLDRAEKISEFVNRYFQ